MSFDPRNSSDVEHRLWDEIESRHVGMLVLPRAADLHAQPMTAFVERDTRRLWFFARTDTELVRRIGRSERCLFLWQHGDMQASLAGDLAVLRDRARIDRFWNAVVAAWHPGGRSDPKLTLLAMDCDDAEVWVAQSGPMKAVWEIAKANATHHEPELGARMHLTFH
ncbi:MAG TPA: pyridoxamine 5'-phosphate oxidase family protein [Caulobacteraceae bacterium]|jgi:general stress protein 26